MTAHTEIEVKILGVDRDALEERLISRGAKKLFDGMIQDRTFDFDDGHVRSEGMLLRLRLFSDGRLEVTYKGPREDSDTVKKREERTHTSSDSIDDVLGMFATIGLRQMSYQEKRRVSYQYKDVRVEIDMYPHIPVFAEIEGPSEEAIQAVIADLGLEQLQISLHSAHDLFTQYRPAEEWNNLHF